MDIELYLSRWFNRLASMALALACLAGLSVALAPGRTEGGTLVIPAWSFARGNVRICADPKEYADAGPVIVGGPRRPWGWTVEYDIDIPVTAAYTLQICYASTEARAVQVSFDNKDREKCCFGVTFERDAGGRPGKLTANSSAARWEGLRRRRLISLLEIKLDKGPHTLKLARRGPLPHIAAIRLDTPDEFPPGWNAPKYKVRDLKSVPAKYHKMFRNGSFPEDRYPTLEPAGDRRSGTITIGACTFDRGNVRIYASPDEYADAGPMAGGGPRDGKDGVVEYDIDFPAAGEYTLQVRYSAAEARPTEFLFDAKRIGVGCNGVTIGSSRFEIPVAYSWSSRIARWEQVRREGKVVRISTAAGRHTLKLTRRGPLPNLLELRFNASGDFPGDWKQPERKVRHIDRVPPRYRSGFMPPGAVNIAALRQAIADTSATFGSRYSGGRERLEKLSDLEAKKGALADGSAEQLQELHDELTALRSDALMSHPALNFDKLLFIKRSSAGYGHTYADQHSGKMGGNLCVLSPVSPEGKATPLVPELDGGLFDRFDLSYDAKKLVFGYRPPNRDDEKGKPGRGHRRIPESYRIYEIDLNPETGLMVSGSLRQLTFGGGDEDAEAIRRNRNRVMCVGQNFDDMDPCYLPDGKIMFTSTRAMQIVFCAPGSSVTNLYLIDADGKNLRRISNSPVNETAPSIMEDGRVIYTRWEYLDKGLGNGQSLWAIRPDGSGVDHVYKNNTIWPAAMSSARGIPGSRKIVTVSGGHHFAAVGPVVLVDARRSRRTTDAMDCITPEVGYPPSMGYPRSRFGTFMDPYPFSEKFFLVSHRPSVRRNRNARYALYVLDAWGNKAELHRDPEMSCFQALPLRARRRPTMVAKMSEAENPKTAKPAVLFVQNVYEGMKGIERGRVKYLRVMGALPWAWNHRGISWALGHKADPHRKKIYGVAKVHEDGSAYFTAPAGENIFFHALDENYMALQLMPTFINMMPGETRSCVGCHELRRKAPGPMRAFPEAMKYPPQALAPQPGDKGPRMVHFATDVQPIFDKHCVGCHGGEKPKARLDLAGVPTSKYSRGYENLIDRDLVSFADCRYGSSNFVAVPPLTRGSHLSKLSARIRKDPCKAKITRAEFIRTVTWIDANVPYYGTYRGKRNLQDKDDPDFRLPPLLAAP